MLWFSCQCRRCKRCVFDPRVRKTPLDEDIATHSSILRASLIAPLVKNLPAMQETWIQSLGWEDPLEKGKATHFSTLAWRIPWTIHIQSMGLQSQRGLSDFHFHVFFPGRSMDRGTWSSIVHVVTKSWTRLKQLSMHAHGFSYITLKYKNSNTYLCMTAMTLSYTECTYYWLHKSLNFVIKN